MKEIIEHLLKVEKAAKKIIADAEDESRKILEDASLKARETVQKGKGKASEDGQKLYEKIIAEALNQKTISIESAGSGESPQDALSEEKRERAVRTVMSEIAGLS